MTKHKYKVVSDAILEAAQRAPKDQLPSEREICTLFDVSRITAKKALDHLAEQGLVSREVGRGTFLREEKAQHRITVFIFPGNPEVVEFFKQEASLYEQANAGTRFEVVTGSDADFLSLATTSDANHAILLCSAFCGYLAQLGLLKRLDQQSDFMDVLSRQQGGYARWQTLPVEGESIRSCFAIPLFLQSHIFGFNRDFASALGLDKEGPRTWQDIIDWGRASHNSRIDGLECSTTWNFGNTLPHSYALTANKGTEMISDANHDVAISAVGCRESLGLFKQVIEETKANVVEGYQRSSLVEGKALFQFEVGPWAIRQSQEDGTLDRMGFCPIPTPTAEMTSFSSVSSWQMSVANTPLVAEETMRRAWGFLAQCCSHADSQRRLTQQFSCISIERTCFEQQQQDRNMLPFISALSTSRLRCDHPLQHPFYKQVMTSHRDVLLNQKPIDEACHEIEIIGKALLSMQGTSAGDALKLLTLQ